MKAALGSRIRPCRLDSLSKNTKTKARQFLLRTSVARDAESDAPVVRRGILGGSRRAACGARTGLPIATADHLRCSGRRTRWIVDIFGRILAVQISGPFRDVAVHVDESPGIGREPSATGRVLAKHSGPGARVWQLAVEVGLDGRDVLTGRECRGGPGTTGILPLGLCWKTINDLVAGLSVQRRQERLDFREAHVFDRTSRPR